MELTEKVTQDKNTSKSKEYSDKIVIQDKK